MRVIKNRKILFGIGLVIFFGLVLFSVLRGRNGGWICKDGIWVSQGNPSKPRPLVSCDNKEGRNNDETKGEDQDNSENETLSGVDSSIQQEKEGVLSGREIVGDDIRINSLGIGDVIKSPIKITGSAKGWYFEGSFKVQIIGENDEMLFDGLAQAQGDWMQDDYVPFEIELNFDNKGLEKGKMVFKKSNPSGLEENSKELSFLILFR